MEDSLCPPDLKSAESFDTYADITKECFPSCYSTVPDTCFQMGGIFTRSKRYLASIDLMYVVEHDLTTKVDELIKKGANVSIQDREGITPLMLAAKHNNIRCMDLLITGGANLGQIDRSNQTALNYAVIANSKRCLEFLIKAGADVNHYSLQSGYHTTPLIDATLIGDFTTVKLLVESGADVNAEMLIYELTALMIACESNCIACVKLLLRAGAFVNIRRRARSNTAIESYLFWGRNHDNYRELLTLLFTAGESIRKPKGSHASEAIDLYFGCATIPTPVPNFLKELMQPNICLAKICRSRIRKHLIVISNVNLFVRVPKLGLPADLQSFLLYDMSVEM